MHSWGGRGGIEGMHHPLGIYADVCFTRSVIGPQQVIEYEEGEGATNRIVDEDDDVRDGVIEV